MRSGRTREPWHAIHEFGWIGGFVPWHPVLLRSPKACAVLTEVQAFPEGLWFHIDVQFVDEREDADRVKGIWPAFDLSVTYADGRVASTRDRWDGDGIPDHPLLQFVRMGGSGSGPLIERRCEGWLWPLPPDGPVIWMAEWGAMGAGKTSTTLDGGDLSERARQAREILRWDPSKT
jgi:hypothetical protein